MAACNAGPSARPVQNTSSVEAHALGVGALVGDAVGLIVGAAVGAVVGAEVGAEVGTGVGVRVGAGVSVGVCPELFTVTFSPTDPLEVPFT
jgi:hypothetical protein